MKGTFSGASRLLALFALLALTGALPATAQVRVDVFSGFTPSGGGTPYSGLVGSFISPDVAFATNNGYAWHPFGLASFGADITGCITLPKTSTVRFALNSDDGSLLFLDGVLNVNNGGAHPPAFVAGSPVTLTGGVPVPFEIQFFECCGGPSGVDLLIDTGSGFVLAPASIFVSVPTVTCSTAVPTLWPPNHDLVDVGFSFTVTACGTAATTISVTSNEPANPPGDDRFSPDAAIVRDTAGNITGLRLRSERAGDGDGRVYLIKVTATDALGRQGSACCAVTVTHDQSAASEAQVAAAAAAALAACNSTGAVLPYNVLGPPDGPAPVVGPKQ